MAKWAQWEVGQNGLKWAEKSTCQKPPHSRPLALCPTSLHRFGAGSVDGVADGDGDADGDAGADAAANADTDADANVDAARRRLEEIVAATLVAGCAAIAAEIADILKKCLTKPVHPLGGASKGSNKDKHLLCGWGC